MRCAFPRHNRGSSFDIDLTKKIENHVDIFSKVKISSPRFDHLESSHSQTNSHADRPAGYQTPNKVDSRLSHPAMQGFDADV